MLVMVKTSMIDGIEVDIRYQRDTWQYEGRHDHEPKQQKAQSAEVVQTQEPFALKYNSEVSRVAARIHEKCKREARPKPTIQAEKQPGPLLLQ
jgi:hypothetical protein